ncbi:MAG: ABC transporter permease [Polyangiales bacterium]
MDPRLWQRFVRNRGALVGAVLVALVVLLAGVGPWFAPHAPARQFTDRLITQHGLPRGPLEVPGFVLGADPIGRDELSRLLYGGRVSLQVACLATLVALIIGLGVGVTTGYFGGAFDFAWMRFIDVVLSLPFLLIAMALNQVVDNPALWSLALLLGLLSWTTLARVTRAKTMQVCRLDYVQAARALGLGHTAILWRHVLPNVLGPAIVIATTLVAQMVLVESAMSYLGLGVTPPAASWGSMLREGQEMLAHVPRLVVFPGLLISATVFGFNLLGEGLRDALDPKT